MKVEIKNLNKKFGKRTIYESLSYSFKERGLYALVGPSGCGKSTLLEMIAGIDNRYQGTIKLWKTVLKNKKEVFRSDFRLKNIGYLRQSYDLLELENVLDNISLPLKAVSKEKSSFQRKRAKALIKEMNVGNKGDGSANRLSGGQKQRVGLARAIINSPSILLCDEPTGALDAKNAALIYEKLKSISKTILVIMVTHDEEAAFKYADCVLRVANGALSAEKDTDEALKQEGQFKMRKRSNVKRVPLSSWIKHAFHLCKERKKRTLLSLLILSFSFISIGLATYLSSDISNEIDRSFASILGEGSFVMERKGSSGETIGKTITASETDVVELVENNPEIEDFGTYYFADFASYFKDFDAVYIDNGASKIVLKGLSIRSINESLWLDDYPNLECYPERPKNLENDQIVLGLPYADMFQICLQLHLLRDYEHLGEYIGDNGLNIIFSVSNTDWNYDDEQIVSVSAIVPSSVIEIYTYNHRWSEHMYEERMCFPTTNDEEFDLPWMMQKAFYIKPANTGSEMMKQIRETANYEKFIFEPDSSQYDQSHCTVGKMCGTNRYYVFIADKASLSYEDIANVKKQSGIDSFLVGTSYSYTSYPNNMMTGFAFPFYATDTKEMAETMLDLATALEEQDGVTNELPDSVVEGSYLLPASTSLTISNDFSNLLSGRKPYLTSEIAISSALAKKWDNPSTIHLVGLVNQDQIGSSIINEYRISKVRVVGIVEDSWNKLFVDSYWPIDFFRDELGMSSFLLEPTKCIFEYGNKEVSDTLTDLKASFQAYDFTDPSAKISSSTGQIFDYLKISLSLMSISCFAISFLLLFVSVILTILENKKEGSILFNLGFRRLEIERSLNAINLLITVPSGLLAVLTISGMEIFLHKQVGNNFGVDTAFRFSFLPPLAILLSGLIAFLLIRLFIHFYVMRRNFSEETKTK